MFPGHEAIDANRARSRASKTQTFTRRRIGDGDTPRLWRGASSPMASNTQLKQRSMMMKCSPSSHTTPHTRTLAHKTVNPISPINQAREPLIDGQGTAVYGLCYAPSSSYGAAFSKAFPLLESLCQGFATRPTPSSLKC